MLMAGIGIFDGLHDMRLVNYLCTSFVYRMKVAF